MPADGWRSVTVPAWLLEEIEKYLAEREGTRYQTHADLLVAAFFYWRSQGAPEIPVKSRNQWLREALLAGAAALPLDEASHRCGARARPATAKPTGPREDA